MLREKIVSILLLARSIILFLPGVMHFLFTSSLSFRYTFRILLFVLLHRDLETALDPIRLLKLAEYLQLTAKINGDVMECGSYKGGSACVIAYMLKIMKCVRTLYVCDTFEGHPYESKFDTIHRKGMFSDVNVKYVRHKFKHLGLEDHVTILKGKFEDTFDGIKEKMFSFAHVDCDLYDGAKFCCNFLYRRMPLGACIIFDDYGDPNAPGLTKAVDDFLADKEEKPEKLTPASSFLVKKIQFTKESFPYAQ